MHAVFGRFTVMFFCSFLGKVYIWISWEKKLFNSYELFKVIFNEIAIWTMKNEKIKITCISFNDCKLDTFVCSAVKWNYQLMMHKSNSIKTLNTLEKKTKPTLEILWSNQKRNNSNCEYFDFLFFISKTNSNEFNNGTKNWSEKTKTKCKTFYFWMQDIILFIYNVWIFTDLSIYIYIFLSQF